MTETDWITIVAVAEAAIILAAVLAVVLFFALRGRSRDDAAAVGLVRKVEAGEPARRERLRGLLADSVGLEGAALDQAVARLIVQEEQFYQELLRTYLHRDSAGLLSLDERLQSVLEPYLELPRQVQAAAPAVAEEESIAAPADPQLKKMSDDLALYRDTLNRVFSEYTAMFGVNLDRGQQLSAAEILQRLESGELAGAGQEMAVETEMEAASPDK